MKNLSKSLLKHVEYVLIDMKKEKIEIDLAQKFYYIFRQSQEEVIEELDEETTEEAVNVANNWILPNKQFDGLYERYHSFSF